MSLPVPPTSSTRFQNRHIIVAAGFGVGIAGVTGYLPTISFFGSSAPYVWAGIIGFSGFTWYKEYHERAQRMNDKLQKGFVRTPDYDYRQGQEGAPAFQPSDAGKNPLIQGPPAQLAPNVQPVAPVIMVPGDSRLYDEFEKG